MVSVNENGVPQEVQKLRLLSETEKKLFKAGKMRREMRKEINEKNKELHVDIDT